MNVNGELFGGVGRKGHWSEEDGNAFHIYTFENT
jgi:hypothetical protein